MSTHQKMMVRATEMVRRAHDAHDLWYKCQPDYQANQTVRFMACCGITIDDTTEISSGWWDSMQDARDALVPILAAELWARMSYKDREAIRGAQ